MTHFKTLRTTVCIAALVTGNAAFADVTAQQVWDTMKDQMSVYDPETFFVGGENLSGGTLTVTNVTMGMGDSETDVVATIDELVFEENGDGTVSVSISDGYDIVISDPENPALNRGTVALDFSGMDIQVSGTPENLAYDITADKYTVTLENFLEDGAAIPLSGVLTLNNVTGSYAVVTTDVRTVDYDVSSSTADIFVDFTEGSDAFSLSGQIGDLSTQATLVLPLEMDPDAPEQMFADGFSVDSTATTGSSSYLIGVTDDAGRTDMTATTAGGTFAFGTDKDGISLDSSIANLAVSASGGSVPFPVDFSLGEYGLAFNMPLSKTDEPTDFGMSVDLVDLAVNDMIWSMVDPTSTLPRDPATAQIDLSGTGKLFYNLMNPEEAAAMELAEVPGELNSLDLNSLKLAIAGALVTGTGAFTFDNTDLVTFDGLPRPMGELNLAATGINGLMDKLVAMGLVPEEQVMGARMMMGMFATVTGDDQLASKLVVNAEGHVLVNDQRIK